MCVCVYFESIYTFMLESPLCFLPVHFLVTCYISKFDYYWASSCLNLADFGFVTCWKTLSRVILKVPHWLDFNIPVVRPRGIRPKFFVWWRCSLVLASEMSPLRSHACHVVRGSSHPQQHLQMSDNMCSVFLSFSFCFFALGNLGWLLIERLNYSADEDKRNC